MSLDPQAKAFLNYLESLGRVPINMLTPEKNRKGAIIIAKKTAMPPQPVAKVEDRSIPVHDGKIKLRIYTPEGAGPFAMFVFFHGGGWVTGNLDTVDAPLRAVANYAQRIVISVDYRLAPEYKFPTPVDDCYIATKWVAENASFLGGNSKLISIGGESAGGNLAAVVCLIARDKGHPFINSQVLLYPATDFTGDYPSREKFNGYFLSKDDMQYFEKHYLRTIEDRENILASPILAKDLSGLPRALVVTAEYDPLHDEGEAYAESLKRNGVDVTYYCYKGMIHGFFGFGGIIDKGIELIEQIASFLKKSTKLTQ